MKFIKTTIKGLPATICRFDILISVEYNHITDQFLDSYQPSPESVTHLLQKLQFALFGNSKRKFTLASTSYLIDYVSGQNQKAFDSFSYWTLESLKNSPGSLNKSSIVVSTSPDDIDYIPKRELKGNVKQNTLWYVLPIAIVGETTEVIQAAQKLNSLLSDRSSYKDFCGFIFESTCLLDIVNICTKSALTLVPPTADITNMILIQNKRGRSHLVDKK